VQVRDFVQILRARWMTVVACTLVVLGAAAIMTIRITPVYTAQARVFLSAQATDPAESENTGTYVITQKDLTTYIQLLSSPAVLDPLREDVGLPPGAGVDVSAEVAEGASILDVTARSADPQLAADLANAAGPALAAVAGEFSTLLASAGQEVAATTIASATVPTSPTSPDVEQNLLLGALLGLLLGVGLAFVRHSVDTKVRDEKDLAALSTSPLLGKLPLDKSASGSLVSVDADPHGSHAESVRRLRTNLMFVDVTTGGHSFVVTSAMPGEGKTTTCINLGMALADAGSKVLVIDADLRNPSIARTMGLEGVVGLTTILLGRATPEDVTQRWRDTSLHVLAAGEIPPNPSELLGSEPMEALFTKLSHDYDLILVDSPPVVPVIDAVLIQRLTGGLLMVVSADRTKKRDLSSAIRSLATVDVKISGFALNKIATKATEKYRYGYYRYDESGNGKPARRGGRRRRKGAGAGSRGQG
jgi:succinoglycan biosynthesis transport protein ExoP